MQVNKSILRKFEINLYKINNFYFFKTLSKTFKYHFILNTIKYTNL